MQPEANDKSRICLNFNVDGLTVLCNREALTDLRDQLDWLINSPLDEHYHCHVLWSLENDQSRFDGKRPRNAGVSFSEGFAEMGNADIAGGQMVDLTFVVATDVDLDDAQKHQK